MDNDDEHIIPTGQMKKKKIELASHGGVGLLQDIADEFMKPIFDQEPGDYLITDESSLYDFAEDVEAVYRRIREVYDLDVSDLSGNLLEVFVKVHEAKRDRGAI